MDKVKIFLAQLKKHHFWVLTGMAALVGFICWWMGASSLARDTAANEGTVKSSYKSMQDLEGNAHPPNGRFAEGINTKNDDLKKQVLAEWQQRYDQQQQLFSWPEIVSAEIVRLKPEDPIPEDVRLLCKNNEVFLDALRDKVLLTADYRHTKAAAPVPPPAAPAKEGAKPADDEVAAAPPVEEIDATEVGLVKWARAHQEFLEQRFTLRRNSGTPSTLNIRLAQEDIWMLENLAKVIRQTNQGAEDVIAVPIKRIDTLDIAQWAINDAVRDTPKVFADASTTDPNASTGGLGNSGQAGGPEAPVDPAEREKQLDDELLNGRYIGDTGQPLQAADPAPYAEFKLMFVRMKVVIDQRKIPDLLVNCANAPIPIEIVRFRMDEPLVSTGSGNAGNAPAGGAGGGRPGGLAAAAKSPTGTVQNRGGGGGNSSQADEIEANPSDVTVEVCGLVQIYTAPDEAKLGTGTATDPGKRPAGVPTAVVKAPRASASTSSSPFGNR